jgi:hypothetical protein
VLVGGIVLVGGLVLVGGVVPVPGFSTGRAVTGPTAKESADAPPTAFVADSVTER